MASPSRNTGSTAGKSTSFELVMKALAERREAGRYGGYNTDGHYLHLNYTTLAHWNATLDGVVVYLGDLRLHRTMARQALVKARAWLRTAGLLVCGEHSDCVAVTELGKACARATLDQSEDADTRTSDNTGED